MDRTQESLHNIIQLYFRWKRHLDLVNDNPWIVNTVLKSIIFAQDVHETVRIEEIIKEKGIKMMDYFTIQDNKNHDLIYQGSVAEGVQFNIERFADNEDGGDGLDTVKGFDVDVVYMKKDQEMKLLTDDEEDLNVQHSDERHKFFLPTDQGSIFVRRVKDDVGFSPDHVQLLKTGLPNDSKKERTYHCIFSQDIQAELKHLLYKSAHPPGEKCEDETFRLNPGESFDKFGDLCNSCRGRNVFLFVTAKDNMNMSAFLNMIRLSGPAVAAKYITQTGRKCRKRKLFNEKKSEKSIKKISGKILPLFSTQQRSTFELDHVPVYSFPFTTFDDGKSCKWPLWAKSFFSRNRLNGWPSQKLLQLIMEEGCCIVPSHGLKAFEFKKERQSSREERAYNEDPVWRVSFSQAEKLLMLSLNEAQRRCYMFFRKIVFYCTEEYGLKFEKNIKEDRREPTKIDAYKKCISPSLIAKHTFLWVVEETEPLCWRENNTWQCLAMSIKKLQGYVADGFVPHYILGTQRNLLEPAIRSAARYCEKPEPDDLNSLMLPNTAKLHRLITGYSPYIYIDQSIHWSRARDQAQKNLERALCILNTVDPNIIVSILIKTLYVNDLDSIWYQGYVYQNACDLHETFDQIVNSIPSNSNLNFDNLKSRFIAHNERLLKFIAKAPDVYGIGKNAHRISFIEKELQFLKTCSLEQLDQKELSNMKR